MSRKAEVKVTTVIAAAPEEAFRVFTEELDLWWKRGFRFRTSADPSSTLRFEPGENRKLVEFASDLPGGRYEFGSVKVWKPAERLTFEFRARANAVGEESEVDVVFEASGSETRVTVTQTGWEDLPADHPVRHGMDNEAMFDMMALFWGDLLTGARILVQSRSEDSRSAE